MSGGLLATGRRAAERQMVDTCVIGPLVRGTVLDEDTGEYTSAVEPVYEGPCKLTMRAVQVADIDSAGQDLAVADAVVAIPVEWVGSAAVGKDHVARITVGTDHDVIVEAVVQAAPAQTFATARRLPVLITT